MPEVDFILAPEEQMHLLEYLLSQGLLFVPDLRYTEPQYVILDQLEEIRKYTEGAVKERLFFVLSSTYTQHSLEMREVVSIHDQTHFYYVAQRHGGPYLDLLLSTKQEGLTPLLVSGFSAYYRSYWSGTSRMEIPAPNELKLLHKSILAWLGNHGRCVITGKVRRRYWVGRGAEDMLLRGVKSNVNGLHL